MTNECPIPTDPAYRTLCDCTTRLQLLCDRLYAIPLPDEIGGLVAQLQKVTETLEGQLDESIHRDRP